MMKNKLQSDFAKNIFTLFSGTFIAQILPVVASFFLARLYAPANFGNFGIFMAIISIMGVLATFRFEYAIVLPKHSEDAKSLIGLGFIITSIITCISIILILLFKNLIINALAIKSIANESFNWFYLIPASIFFLGLNQLFNYWSTRNQTFKLNAKSKILQSLILVVSSLIFGYLQFGTLGMVLGYLLGQTISTLFLIFHSLYSLKKIKRPFLNQLHIKQNLKHYKEFAFVNTPHALVGSFQDNGIIFLIGYFFSSSILGFYSFALRVVTTPISMISSSLYQVFYPHASKMYNNGEDLSTFIIKTYKKMALIGLPFFIFFYFLAPWLFAFFFGDKWHDAGKIAQILSPWLFLNFIVTPVSCIPLIVNKQRTAFFIQLIDITMKYGAIILGGLLKDYIFGFTVFSIWGSLLMLFGLWWYHKISKLKYVAEIN